jgi:zinc D-Ala-D-Ala dipeptidase
VQVNNLGFRSYALGGAIITLVAISTLAEESLPDGFVRLREVAPEISQDIRYARTFNFTGKEVPGYDAAQCILWQPAAEALARAQKQLANEGLRLKVYDCYRPVGAVRAFADWSKESDRESMKRVFYPALDKSRLFALGYIASRSKHSLGIAVDVGLVRIGDADLSPQQAGACDGDFEDRAKESSLDFGTSFDCFSKMSATAYPGISAEARTNRDRLVRVLENEGFRNYSREWWHFEFNAPNAPTEPYDFPVR